MKSERWGRGVCAVLFGVLDGDATNWRWGFQKVRMVMD